MFKLNLFTKPVTERMLRVRLPGDVDPESALEQVFAKLVDDSRLVSVETVAGGTIRESVYSVVLKRDVSAHVLLEAVRQVNGNNKVSLIVGQQEVDL